MKKETKPCDTPLVSSDFIKKGGLYGLMNDLADVKDRETKRQALNCGGKK